MPKPACAVLAANTRPATAASPRFNEKRRNPVMVSPVLSCNQPKNASGCEHVRSAVILVNNPCFGDKKNSQLSVLPSLVVGNPSLPILIPSFTANRAPGESSSEGREIWAVKQAPLSC